VVKRLHLLNGDHSNVAILTGDGFTGDGIACGCTGCNAEDGYLFSAETGVTHAQQHGISHGILYRWYSKFLPIQRSVQTLIVKICYTVGVNLAAWEH
jgi:hypothetical protein